MEVTTSRPLNGIAKEANNTQSGNEELIKMEGVQNTPFTVVETETEITIVFGKYKVGTYENKLKAYQAIDARDWNLMMNTLIVLIEESKGEK